MAQKSKMPLLLLIISGIALLGLIAFRGRMSPSATILKVLRNSRYSALANYWLAVAKFETANFTSRLWTQYSNPWGMNCVQVRKTTQVGCTDKSFDGGMSKGIYKNAEEAAQDIIYYMDSFKYPISFPNIDEFVAFMKSKGYFTADYQKYLSGVKRYLNG